MLRIPFGLFLFLGKRERERERERERDAEKVNNGDKKCGLDLQIMKKKIV
jgi:hypothetical protein